MLCYKKNTFGDTGGGLLHFHFGCGGTRGDGGSRNDIWFHTQCFVSHCALYMCQRMSDRAGFFRRWTPLTYGEGGNVSAPGIFCDPCPAGGLLLLICCATLYGFAPWPPGHQQMFQFGMGIWTFSYPR